MKTLSCKQASALLPLHVAGDTEGASAREVATHLAVCQECRALADGFRESRSLLMEACASPEFDDEFYASVRSVVLAEVARDHGTPSTPSFIASLFGRRLVFATTFALLLFACLVALQHLRREMPRQIAVAQPDEHAPSREIVSAVNAPPPQTVRATAAPNSQIENDGRNDSASLHIFIAAKRDARALHNDVKVRRGAPEAPRTSQRLRDEFALVPPAPLAPAQAETVPAPSAIASASAASGAAPEASRIEIQTADPNIRIIWLAPQKAEELSPNHDQHENGDTK